MHKLSGKNTYKMMIIYIENQLVAIK